MKILITMNIFLIYLECDVIDVIQRSDLVDIEDNNGEVPFDKITENKFDVKGWNPVSRDNYLSIKFTVPFKPYYLDLNHDSNVKTYRFVIRDGNDTIEFTVNYNKKYRCVIIQHLILKPNKFLFKIGQE
jgi:hypothetical protein